ncbi:MAG TPA: hypothetical protein DDX92_12995 [Flavobacteriales bacterium]|jgi:hypothetical protein|nr:hypothetical protein [Flavobacteriales bacterium]
MWAFRFLLFLCTWIVQPTTIAAPGGGSKDTVVAKVVYGDEYLLANVETYNLGELNAFRDSIADLESYSEGFIQQLDLYLSIPEMSDQEVVYLIDSLFTLETIPYPLINQINEYIANRSRSIEPNWEDLFSMKHPSDDIYSSWNTQMPNPSSYRNLAKNDSTQKLRLTGHDYYGGFVMPIEGPITSGFGWRDGRNHNGVDIDLQVWDTVKVCFAGMVRVARYYGGYGRVVVVRHHNGLETYYAHLHRLKVKPGDIVQAGDVIGLGGSSGQSTGSHLHWEIRYKGVPINPFHLIDFRTDKLLANDVIIRKTNYGYVAYPEGSVFYTVRRGDFLHKIAEAYGTSISKICELNGIRRNQVLYVGQKLRVI